MSELVDLYRQAADLFEARVAAVGAGQWHDPTPCTDWDVHTLVNHVVGEQRWAPHLLAGETIEQVGDRYDGDLLGDDPLATWREAIGPALDGFAADGALEGIVHLSYGDEASREYLLQMLTDVVVHGWDLARAVGGDEHMDDATAQLLYDTWSPRAEMLEGSGVFGAPVEVPEGASVGDRLLGLLGRTP